MHWKGQQTLCHPSPASERLFVSYFLVLSYPLLCRRFLKRQYVPKHLVLSDALDFFEVSYLSVACSRVLAWKRWSPTEIRPVLKRRVCLEEAEEREDQKGEGGICILASLT